MKKILVTGAGGTIGIHVLEKLLKFEDYEITALDLKSAKTVKRLNKYKNGINIVFGDITDKKLMSALIKDHNTIIHLAGIIPPLANIKESISKVNDYEGTKCIIKAINEVNPNCYLLFASTTTVYGLKDNNMEITVKTSTNIDTDDSYSMTKKRCEEKIIANLKNYTIFRLPAILGDLKYDAPMYNIPRSSIIEFITASNAATAFVNAINVKAKINKKIYNISGGKNYQTTFNEYLIKVLRIYGLSIRYLGTLLLVDKNFYSGYYADGDAINEILDFRNGSLDKYFVMAKNNTSGFRRLLPRFFALPFILVLKIRQILRKQR